MILVDAIFRVTNPGDDEGNVGSTEKIEFNTGANEPDTTGRLTRIQYESGTDLNPHPNPGIPLNPIQDSELGQIQITLEGYFVNRTGTVGPTNLITWNEEDKKNSDFRNGRFGLNLATMNGELSLEPTTGKNGQGYILSSLRLVDFEGTAPKIGFIAVLKQNGVI